MRRAAAAAAAAAFLQLESSGPSTSARPRPCGTARPVAGRHGAPETTEKRGCFVRGEISRELGGAEHKASFPAFYFCYREVSQNHVTDARASPASPRDAPEMADGSASSSADSSGATPPLQRQQLFKFNHEGAPQARRRSREMCLSRNYHLTIPCVSARAVGSEETANKICQSFLSRAAETRANLQKATLTDNMPTLRRMHTLSRARAATSAATS